MTATETKLKPLHYGLLRLISEDPGITFSEIRLEAPGIHVDDLEDDIKTLVERGLLRVTFRGGEDFERYAISHTGRMLITHFENSKPAVPKPILHVAAQWGAVVLLLGFIVWSVVAIG